MTERLTHLDVVFHIEIDRMRLGALRLGCSQSLVFCPAENIEIDRMRLGALRP